MNFGELCQDVFTHTNSPHLLAETQLAVRTATLKFHMIDFFMRDLAEKRLDFTGTSLSFQVPILSTFERWRKFKYIRPFDLSNVTTLDIYMDPIDPAAIFDEFKRNRQNVFYVAGTALNMRCSSAQSSFLVGWYQYPTVTPTAYASWIADMYPTIIVEEAAGRILHAIGMTEEGNKFVDPQKGSIYAPMTGHLAVLRANEIEAIAR